MLVNKFKIILLFLLFLLALMHKLNTNDTIDSILNQNKNHSALTSYVLKRS